MVKVIDSPCGSGKSTYCLNLMKNDKMNRYIYVTPFLSEVKRASEYAKYYEPKQYGYGKLDSFKRLLANGFNIATTHALFYLADEDVMNLIKDGNYTLILDEVMNVVEQYKLSKQDMYLLDNSDFVKIHEDGRVEWILKETYTGAFSPIMSLAKRGQLYKYGGKLFLWTFPIGVFEAFKESIICTYLFDAQVQRYYYDFFGVKYKKYSIKDGELIPYKLTASNLDKIHILESDKLNSVGDNYHALSKSWFDKRTNSSVILLKNNMYNYYRNVVNTSSKDIMWTTFKDYKSQLASNGFRKSFVPCNARATNDYAHVHNIMYCINMFNVPFIVNFFKNKGVEVNEEEWALSEMIQFIYRSAIRKGEHINLYIPSARMRKILTEYINHFKEK